VPLSEDASAIPVGVVGVGHLGRHHARLYASMPGVRLVGVVDTDAARAREIAAEYGCEALADVASLAGRVRGASVAVPTVGHRAVAVQLLEGGVDVLVEKPLASSLEEADAILRAAQGTGALVMVGHTERFNPAIRALTREVDNPRFLEMHRLSGFSARSTDIDVVLDLMIHDLDLLLHLDGSDPVSVDAIGVAALTDKIDIANARIRMASGCIANLTASRISAESVRRVRVFQAQTYLGCDTVERTVERYLLVREPGRAASIRHDSLSVESGEPLALELAAFVDSIRDRVPPPVDGAQGRRAMELAYTVRAAIEAMAPPPGST
jgi:predicted dehydrogenase